MDVNFDKEKAEPDVIDNREAAMADVLNENLRRISSLDVSSGYFEISGYSLVRRALEAAAAHTQFSFRLMIGKNALKPPEFDTFEEYARHAELFGETLKADLDRQDLDNTHMGDIAGLLDLLKRDNVQVRRNNEQFNHSKCYILGQAGALVGSSNFTFSGLSRNDELNVGVYTTGTWKKIKEWYDRMWAGATDAKGEMVQVLEQSKFGVPATPYEVYLKILFERYKRMLTAMTRKDTAAGKTLAEFQQHAVYSILQTIEERGGAMLADSTGLGKTHIGLEVMRKKMSEGKKVLLIAPAQVRDTVWRAKLEEYQINARTIGTEMMGQKDFDVLKYRKYDFVIIDESQNFRSSTARRRTRLMQLMSLRKKQVLLMSATPINNSLMDLYYQISIITGGRDDLFADIGIPDLYRYMRKAANHRLNDGLEKIQTLLDTIMVRRTRTYIREVYPDEKINGIPITFPARDYKPVKYGMTDLFGNVYRDLLDTIYKLKMAPYGIEGYNLTLTDEEKRKHKVLAHLQVILLLKRFESSVKAVTVSINNKITLFEYFGSVLKQGRIAYPKQLNKIMLKWNAQNMEGDEAKDEFFMKEIKNLPVQDASDYDIRSMWEDIRSDLRHLRRYRDSLKGIKFDKKAEAVAEMILRDKALETGGGKVLIFTEYTATAEYIREYLAHAFADKEVGLITGGVSKARRPDIIRRFSPIANTEEDDEYPDRQIDILVSTEVLSEGQNLQDCNYVVNYDLPWNPMRIVQRIGRIDRLTSAHDTIHSRECFPDEKLDELLTLVGKLMDKIGDINDAIGLDADLLGQEASPKNFSGSAIGHIRAMAGGRADHIAEELERESDLMPKMSPINEISQHIRKTGVMSMEAFAMGRRSGKAGEGRNMVLTYLRESRKRRFYSVVYDCDAKSGRVADDMEAIRLIRCPEDEAAYLPMDGSGHSESFRLLYEADHTARDIISQHDSEGYRIARELRTRRKKNARVVEDIRNIIDEEVINGNLSREEGNQTYGVLDLPDLTHWNEDLEILLDEYNSRGNIGPLISGLKRISDNIGTEEDADEPEEDAGTLRLVGAVFITSGGRA